ncbi:MAG: hypothetical protein JST11_08750 [Acidobacteria bacterium]|nr:hypothetical protein [Acidobacteriota bacterium]
MRNSRLAAAVLCAAAGLVFQWTIVRANYGGNWTALFCHGSEYPVPAALASEHIYVFPGSGGYDGQSYHYVAHDPLNRTGIGRAVPDPARRFPRILVPGLAYLLALGRQEWIDPALFAVNLMFLGLGAYWLACLLPRPMWAVGYVLAPVALISLDRMTVDLALASLALGFAVYARREADRKLWVVMLAAALCRESGFLLFGAWAWREAGRGRWRRIPIFATALVPAIAWNLASGAGHFGYPIPFHGILDAILHPRSYPFPPSLNAVIQAVGAVQLIGLLLGMGLAFRGLRAAGRDAVWNLCLLFAVFGICTPPGTYDDPLAGVRILAPLLHFQLIEGGRWGRWPLVLAAPRAYLELLPQVLRVIGLRVG